MKKMGERYPSEKGDLQELAGLPQPVSATGLSPVKRKIQLACRITLGLLASFYLVKNHLSSDAQIAQSAPRDVTDAYFGGIVNKGLGTALSGEHDHKHKHHDHHHKGHEHKHKPGHHGPKHGMKWVSPKTAEEIFLTVPNNDSCRAASRRYTAYAHPAGSGYDFLSAINLKNEWERELGISVSGPEDYIYDAGSVGSQSRVRDGMGKLGVWIDTYYPVMNTPVSSSVTLLTDPLFEAKLREDIVEGDPDSVLRDEVRVFHGLSVSGDVTGKYVYAGYGQKKDFDLLVTKGIDFTGKIAIVKYGKVFRGLKIKAAQEAGAIGCIIYSDPGDDGDMTEENGHKPYPEGPARNPSSVQRGSVQFISKYPGDPTTPGEPAYPNATRLEGGNQPSIPSLPISYQDAIPILKALKGKGIAASELGSEWVGGLGYHGVEYFTGPSDVDLHLVNEVNTRVMPIWNTMATIPGHITDEVIIVGNHRDAWVLGAADPNSGTASQYEMIRGLGALLKKGWKPLRTIVLASWDAEEYGLIGSTEWAEDFADWIQANTAVYLNLDGACSGSNFQAGASPSLALLLKGAADEVLTPSGKSVWETREDGGNWASLSQDVDVEDLFTSSSGIPSLGSGSDYTAFLERYGVASTDMGYGNGPEDAVYHYHSVYDSFHWQDNFTDPGYHKHTEVAKVLGLIVLRLADSLVLPLNTTQYALDLEGYLSKVEFIAKSLDISDVDFTSLSKSIKNVTHTSVKLDASKHAALEKLRRLLPKPHKRSVVAKLRKGWWKLQRALGKECHHEAQMELFDEKYTASHGGFKTPKFPTIPMKKLKEIKAVLKEIREINLKLKNFESGFISEAGIKEREWYKHKGTAPGIWLGYGATTFPALTEALTIDKSPELAQKEADELADMINAMAVRLAA